MAKEKEVEYVERYNPIDDIESTHYALIQSSEYSHETLEGYTYTDVALGSLYRYWKNESINEIRSERSRKVAHAISERALFEVFSRQQEVKKLEEAYENE